MTSYSEPALNALVTLVAAPTVAVSSADGQIDGPAHGYYRADQRLLSLLRLRIDSPLTLVGNARHDDDSSTATFALVAADINFAPMEGPTWHVQRRRTLRPDGMDEELVMANLGDRAATVRVELDLAADLGAMNLIRSGITPALVSPSADRTTASWTSDDVELNAWSATPADEARVVNDVVTLSWAVTLQPRSDWSTHLVVRSDDARAARPYPFVPPQGQPTLPLPDVGDRHDLSRLARRSIADLESLLLSEDGTPSTTFMAAGSPWYFTLFGRDSLWTSRLLLPFAPWLGEGTLSVLAARQGVSDDPHSEEEPGRMPHEVRTEPVQVYGVLDLPPIYYGNIDAAALWVCLLHDLRLSDDTLRSYLPHMRAALTWTAEHGDRDADGLVEYQRRNKTGLIHQAWKDSATSIRFADGRTAQTPIATCEVQAYAYEAALAGATILDQLGEPDGDRWRSWAAALRERFHATFWIEDAHGPYLAQALDADKRPVDGAASNMGHTLGTGLLDDNQAALVAQRISQPDLLCGLGLRTLSTSHASYNSLSYHRGSIWPHDTVIAVLGLLAEGHVALARDLANGLLRAAQEFSWRLPELYGVETDAAGDLPRAYPTACSPQAWSAASGLVVAHILSDGEHPLGRRRPRA